MQPPRSSLLLEEQERLFVDKKIWAERMDTGTFHLDPANPPSLQEKAINSLPGSSVGNYTSIQAVRTPIVELRMENGWIPAFADSTPRLELKGSGGNDGYKLDSRLRGNDKCKRE
jgi:hypothetical protein